MLYSTSCTTLLCKSSYQVHVLAPLVWAYFMKVLYLWILTMVACIKWTRLWWVLFVQPHSTSPILAWLSFSLVDNFLSSSKFPIHCCARIYLILLLLVKQNLVLFDHFALLAGGVFNCESKKDPIRGTHHYARGIHTPIQCNLVITESFRSEDYTEVHLPKPY